MLLWLIIWVVSILELLHQLQCPLLLTLLDRRGRLLYVYIVSRIRARVVSIPWSTLMFDLVI
jgi:hypothetical protein